MIEIPALVVKQWLNPWNAIRFEGSPYRRRPAQSFLLFSLSAVALKRLTGIQRRDDPERPKIPPAEDPAIQRRHNPERSAEILRYILNGFPLSKISQRKLPDPEDSDTLRMPGWLPTSVLVNIPAPGSKRFGKTINIHPEDRVDVVVHEDNLTATIRLPDGVTDGTWRRKGPAPLEIIDGQHRLWALDEESRSDTELHLPDHIEEYQVPVVAFQNLDTTWQAYLFYTINQLPKRIDTSLVFDLYPLLRTQEWLLHFEGPSIYRETRAQDLTILVWQHPESPWFERILRFGGRKPGLVTQAAFIRSLLSSFVKSWAPYGRMRIGGLFGPKKDQSDTYLSWDRLHQASLLIFIWQEVAKAINGAKTRWAVDLRSRPDNLSEFQIYLERQLGESPKDVPAQDVMRMLIDPAFAGPHTFLGSDMGVRGVHSVMNDLLWLSHENGSIDLENVSWEGSNTEDEEQGISELIDRFRRDRNIAGLVKSIAVGLTQVDWRMPSAIGTSDSVYHRQASFRGSGGYRLIRQELLATLLSSGDANVKRLIRTHADDLRFSEEDEATVETEGKEDATNTQL